MTNGGNYLIEALKKGSKNLPSKPSIGITSSVNIPRIQNYNPNHTDSGRTVELVKINLNNLKIQPKLNVIINKPKNNFNNLKAPINNHLLGSLKTNNIDIPKLNTVENNTGVLEENLNKTNDNINRILDHDLEFKLLEYEGYDKIFLDNVSRIFNLIKSPNSNLSNQLEINVRESFEKSKNFIGLSHLSMMFRSIYKYDQQLDYNEILKYILKMLNTDDLTSINTYKGNKVNSESYEFEQNLEDNIESLLQSIQDSNDKTFSNFNNMNEYKKEQENIDNKVEKWDTDIDYEKEYIYEKTETKNYVTLLSSETLSKLTSYDQNQISDICKILDINENKLSLEEAQFILDEISTIKREDIGQIDEKYNIIEKNGKYYSEIIKSHWVKRPIVVTVMGHVDHGKTSLLDYIHKTDVAKNEKGFITQKISTFQIKSKVGKITFIDTPGHAAFLTMRKRGVSCTDLVILVIAADDGIMPQTLECIDLIKNNELKVIIAINKVDLVSKEVIDKIKEDIRKYFKDSIIINISAKTGYNVDILLSEIEIIQKKLDLKMDKNSVFKGYIYETIQDINRGKCINIIIKQGSLQPNDYVLINDNIIKIKKIYYPNNNNIDNSNSNTNNNNNEEKEKGKDKEKEYQSDKTINNTEIITKQNEYDDNDIIQLNVGINVSNLAGNVIVGHNSLKQLQKYQDLINKQLSQEEQYNNDGEQQDLKCIPFVGINLRCADQGSLEAIENYINELNENLKKNVNVRNLIDRKYLPTSISVNIDNSSNSNSGNRKSSKTKKLSNIETISSNLDSSNSNSNTNNNEEDLRIRYQPYLKEWVPFKIISKNLGDFNTNDIQLQQIGNIINIGFNIQNNINLEKLVRIHEIIYNIFDDLQLIYDFYFGDIYRKKIESNLIVTQIGNITLKGIGKKQAVGTSVKEGQSKLNHYYLIIRNNKIIYNDLNVISFQSNKQNVKILNKGDNNNCLIFKEDVTLQLNDEIVAYVKQPLLPLFDSETNHLLKT